MKRGQAVSTDLVLAIIVFITVVSLVDQLWMNVSDRITDWEERENIARTAFAANSFLVESSGYPYDWKASFEVIGAADFQNVINKDKLGRVLEMDQQLLREALGSPQYPVYIKLTEIDGTIIKEGGEKPGKASYIANAVSYVIYDNEVRLLHVMLWKE